MSRGHISAAQILPRASGGATTVGGQAVYAAYSLRRLVARSRGYPVVRGLRSSDNAERDFLPNSAGFVSTTELESFAAGGDVTVLIWYDQSGNGRHMVPTGSPPHLVIAGTAVTLASKAAIQFGASDGQTKHRLRMPFNIFNSAFTVSISGTRTTYSGSAFWGAFVSGRTAICCSLGWASNYKPSIQRNGGTDSTTGTDLNLNQNYVWSFKATAAYAGGTYSATFYQDNTLNASPSLSFGTDPMVDSYTWLGGAANGAENSGDHWAGKVRDVVIVLSALSDANRNSIETAIAF